MGRRVSEDDRQTQLFSSIVTSDLNEIVIYNRNKLGLDWSQPVELAQ